MTKIGMIDVDNWQKLDDCFPNLVIMKLSAWHKSQGDVVEWYQPMFSGHCDKVYMSKVFSFSEDYPYSIDADEIEYGGSGYCISLANGKEVFDKSKDKELPYEIEHMMPDYSLYGITDTAYGFMSRGCPRGCDFCIVKDKEGRRSYKVADLSEFWNGQKNIELFDPNTLACKDWKDILQQLADSKACVNFNQGVDIRLMTEEKAEMIKKIKVKVIHFAWDRYEDKAIIQPRFEKWTGVFGKSFNRSKVQCYVLCGFKEKRVLDEDIERIMWLRNECNISPYVMLYDKEHIPRGHELRKLQRWVNNRIIFWSCPTFEDYVKGKGAI